MNALVEKAKAVIKHRRLTSDTVVGSVGSALETKKGNIYTGVSINTSCGIGFCAEHSAIAAMITAGESEVKEIVAVTSNGRILPPCGRCREFLYQVNRKNNNTAVIIGNNKSVKLSKLLPEHWQKEYFE